MNDDTSIKLFNLLCQHLTVLNYSVRRGAGYLARQEMERILGPLRADPGRLEPFGFKVHSQNDEDGILAEIFQRIGVSAGTFCEIGVQNGLECNSLYLLHQGWRGVWVEADAEQIPLIEEKFSSLLKARRLHVINGYAMPDSINQFVIEGLSRVDAKVQDLDLLSIDIDGMDIYLLEALESRPKVICIEYNAKFPPAVARRPVFDAQYRWRGTDYMGASLRALNEAAHDKGYVLVGTNITGANAFFVRHDLAEGRFASEASPDDLYNPPRYYLMVDHFLDQVGHRADYGPYVEP